MRTFSVILLLVTVLNFGNQLSAFTLWPSTPTNTSGYGVDVSFPIHHYIDRTKYPYFAKRYADTMARCYSTYSPRECDSTERARIAMNLEQPATQHNYTEMGFKKMRAPIAAWEPLLAFYEANKEVEKLEEWPRGNTYVNHWDSPTYMVSFENRALRGGLNVRKQIWDGVKPIIEEWTGQKVEPTSLYGIRVYKEGSVLATHVDRLPLVSSCIIQVAQDVDEPWPIEVYDHSGRAHNVTMEPGDMVLYESHTVLHGRPFPLKGRKYANVFVHFKPINHDAINEQDQQERLLKKSASSASSKLLGMLGSKTASKGYIGGHEQSNHHDDHLQKHLEAIDAEAEAEEKLRLRLEREAEQLDSKAAALKAALDAQMAAQQENGQGEAYASEAGEQGEQGGQEGRHASVHDPNGRFNRAFTRIEDRKTAEEEDQEHRVVYEEMRDAAAEGDSARLRGLLEAGHAHLIHEQDENGWQLLHEAIRSGDVDTVKLLVDSGADLRVRVSDGGAALWVARNCLDEGHPVIQYLVEIGAPEDKEA